MSRVRRKKVENKSGQYRRLGVISISEVLPHVIFQQKLSGKKGKLQRKQFGEFQINMASLRYQLFALKGTFCVECGIQGSYFALEVDRSAKEGTQPHFNLYGILPNGEEVLITKDHIFPVSKGGKDKLKNLQTMCQKCNVLKSNIVEEGVV